MTYTNISDNEIKNKLKTNLSAERFSHSLGTACCARELAKKFGLNEEKAYIAGLLHDAAKCFSHEKLLLIIKNKLDVDESELKNYKTLHAPVSAYLAEKEFGISDGDILSAIRWHTLGKIDMTDFEKIIFIADKIEPNTRKKEYADEIHALLDEKNGLNKALLKCYKNTIISLVKRDLKICAVTIEVYNQLEGDIQE